MKSDSRLSFTQSKSSNRKKLRNLRKAWPRRNILLRESVKDPKPWDFSNQCNRWNHRIRVMLCKSSSRSTLIRCRLIWSNSSHTCSIHLWMESKEATQTMATCNKTCTSQCIFKDSIPNTAKALTKTCLKENHKDRKLL